MDQAGNPAHQVGLEVVNLAVGAGDVPQHFDHFDPVFEIEAGLEHAGEGVELMRIFHRFFAQRDQCLDLGAGEAEAAFDQPGNGFSFGAVEVAVHNRGFDQKGDRGDLDVIGVVLRVGAVLEDKGLDAVEHGPCLSHPFGQGQPFDGEGLSLPGLARLPTFQDMNETPNSTGRGRDDRPDRRQYAPATGRNRDAILAVLERVLPETGRVVEIGAGSGEHAAYFAPRFPALVWQPTEPDADGRASIAAWAEAANVPNLRPPLDLDVTAAVWPITEADAVFCANMIHIAPWPCCLGLMAGAGRILGPRGEDGDSGFRGTPPAPEADRGQQKAGVLVLYGPFKRDGEHTAPSNADFDAGLRNRDPAWGVRDLGEVAEAALDNGLALEETVDMPANNLMAIFRR